VFTEADILELPEDVVRWMGNVMALLAAIHDVNELGKTTNRRRRFWCELVMNGIGGRTIAEAQERMSLREFQGSSTVIVSA
jgi:hypothetical protein